MAGDGRIAHTDEDGDGTRATRLCGRRRRDWPRNSRWSRAKPRRQHSDSRSSDEDEDVGDNDDRDNAVDDGSLASTRQLSSTLPRPLARRRCPPVIDCNNVLSTLHCHLTTSFVWQFRLVRYTIPSTHSRSLPSSLHSPASTCTYIHGYTLCTVYTEPRAVRCSSHNLCSVQPAARVGCCCRCAL